LGENDEARMTNDERMTKLEVREGIVFWRLGFVHGFAYFGGRSVLNADEAFRPV